MSKRLTSEEFIVKANEIHKNKYDYSLVNYINNKTKIKIICPIHGLFEQKPNNHVTLKQNCMKCSIEINNIFNKKQACTTNEFIKKAINIHGDKYDYSSVKYINKKTKVDIICPIHGIFEQQPNYHLRKSGCQKCSESKGELIITNFLIAEQINFIKQKTFDDCLMKNKLPFDFYLPDYNICIEYDGEQHYKPIKIFGGVDRFIKQQQTDKIKNEYCYNNNIHLFRIKYDMDINLKLIELLF